MGKGAIKKFLLKSTFKKRALLALLFFVSLGLFFPNLASAGVFEFLGGFLSNIFAPVGNVIGNALTIAIFSVLIAASSSLLQFSSMILSWVMSPDFITVCYTCTTGPNANPIIEIGWLTMRNFANIFFIIGLVVIGIATALRYKEYQAQKALPRLIVIALLINFTPVIAGAIIDASNIIMNSFLEGAGINVSWANQLQGQLGTLVSGGVTTNMGATLGKGFVLVALNLVSTVIFLIYAMLFAVRYVALWLLVILSPLAFVCYIFPATKGYFYKWWHQFIQWCFVGIPAILTLFLANQLIEQSEDIGTGPDWGAGFAGFSTFMAQYTVPIIFLIVGFLLTLQTSAMGATSVVKAGRKGAAMAGLATAGAIGAGAKRAMPERVKRRIERMAKEKPPTKEEMAKMGTIKKARAKAGRILMPHALRREVGRRALGITEAEARAVSEAKKKAEGKSPERKLSEIRSPATRREIKVGDFLKAIEQKELRALEKIGMTEEEMVKIGRQTLKASPGEFNKIAKALPDLAEKMGRGLRRETREKAGLVLSPEEREKYGTLAQKITAELSPKDIENLTMRRLEDEEVTRAIHKFWTGRELSKAAQKFGRKFIDKFNTEAKMPERGADWYVHENRPALNYLRGSAAQDLGFEVPPGRTLEEEERPSIETPPPEAPRRKRVYPSREKKEEEKS